LELVRVRAPEDVRGLQKPMVGQAARPQAPGEGAEANAEGDNIQ
jgi:hypothetical protein